MFESPFLLVREEFSFMKTADVSDFNGVKITLRIKNLSSEEAIAGLRFLLDTSLGEGQGDNPFFAGKQAITGETIWDYRETQDHWFSRNGGVSLMGNIPGLTGKNGTAAGSGFLHFANWKHLNDALWKAAYSQGRSFNNPPYSIGDSAVCYYFEPELLLGGESLSYTIYLSVINSGGEGQDSVELNREADMALLRNLIARLDQYIAGEITMREEELASIEQTIARLKARYSLH